MYLKQLPLCGKFSPNWVALSGKVSELVMGVYQKGRVWEWGFVEGKLERIITFEIYINNITNKRT